MTRALAGLLVLLVAACVQPPPPPVADAQTSEIQRRADAALAEGRLEDADQEFTRLLNGGHANAAANIGLGEIALARGDLDKARGLFTDAAESDAPPPAALQGLGLVQLRLTLVEPAASSLRKAVAADPSLWRAWNALGTIHDTGQEWDLYGLA